MEDAKPAIEIRQMQRENVASVAALEQIVNPSPWSIERFRAELLNPGSRCELLFEDGQLAAYLCSWKIIDELEIQNVATAPDFQRRGHAARLLQYVLNKAKHEDIAKVFLEVRVGNIAARTLYEKFQFTISGIRPKYYADNEDAILMELQLQTDIV